MSKPVIAIDPGPQESAYVMLEGDTITAAFKVPNIDLVYSLLNSSGTDPYDCVCERIRSYGMPAGAELFETCEWCGRYWQAWLSLGRRYRWHWMTRGDVKLNLCGSPRAKDANIRQAIIDRFGGKDKAIGTKAQPGPLYGIAGDMWAALAVALTWRDKQRVLEAAR